MTAVLWSASLPTGTIGRVELGIYDHEEYDKAMAWIRKYSIVNEGHDYNEEKDKAKTKA